MVAWLERRLNAIQTRIWLDKFSEATDERRAALHFFYVQVLQRGKPLWVIG